MSCSTPSPANTPFPRLPLPAVQLIITSFVQHNTNLLGTLGLEFLQIPQLGFNEDTKISFHIHLLRQMQRATIHLPLLGFPFQEPVLSVDDLDALYPNSLNVMLD